MAKYKVVKRSTITPDLDIFVISKKIWGIFYWDTSLYYVNREEADEHCRKLNGQTE